MQNSILINFYVKPLYTVLFFLPNKRLLAIIIIIKWQQKWRPGNIFFR